jgi:NAD(P)-dependent dehydrogenase (short-subunit alcohol dehydrogenase family)
VADAAQVDHVQQVAAREDRLHVLINNAGASAPATNR